MPKVLTLEKSMVEPVASAAATRAASKVERDMLVIVVAIAETLETGVAISYFKVTPVIAASSSSLRLLETSTVTVDVGTPTDRANALSKTSTFASASTTVIPSKPIVPETMVPFVGVIAARAVGVGVGRGVGSWLGPSVVSLADVANAVGNGVGSGVGSIVGLSVPSVVGAAVGEKIGAGVGCTIVGRGVGCSSTRPSYEYDISSSVA